MNRNTANHKTLRTALTLLIGVLALMFLVAGIGQAEPAIQQSGTATPVPEEAESTTTPMAEEETTTPAAEEETATPLAEEEATSPAPEETAPAEEETIELEITPTPQAEGTSEPESEATPTAEKGDAAPSGTPEATPEPLSDDELIDMGTELFSMYCAACHQLDGQGIANAYPALAGNAFVLTEDPAPVLRVVYTGRAGMPHFRSAFSDSEIAAVVSYVRNAWSNDASVVSTEEVRTVEEEIYSPSEPMEHSGSSE